MMMQLFLKELSIMKPWLFFLVLFCGQTYNYDDAICSLEVELHDTLTFFHIQV
jgi:hypothetical protein